MDQKVLSVGLARMSAYLPLVPFVSCRLHCNRLGEVIP